MTISRDMAVSLTIKGNASPFVRSIAEAESRWSRALQGMTSQASQLDLFSQITRSLPAARQAMQEAEREVVRLKSVLDQARQAGNDPVAKTFASEVARNLHTAQTHAARLTQEFNRQHASLQTLGADLRRAGIDTTNLTTAQERLLATTRRIAEASRQKSRIGEAREILGAPDTRAVYIEIARLQAAYKRLAESGKISAAEQTQAFQLMADKIKQLSGTLPKAISEASRQRGRIGEAREILGFTPQAQTEREIHRVEAAYNRLRTTGTMTTQELARAHLAMNERVIALRNSTDGWGSRLILVREQLVKLALVGAGLGMAVKQAIDFESAMSDVRKVVDFPTPKAFAEMTADIMAMSREIPVSLTGLASIAEAGGQMGIAAKDIKEFTSMTAKMATAFKMAEGEAGTAIGKMMNVFALNVSQMDSLTDAINHLGNSTNAVERDIISVMNRVGGMSRVFGLANTETAALSTTFLSLGLGPERSATAVNALLRELMTAPTQTEKFKKALQGLGISASQMAANIKKGPQQAILDLLQTISTLDNQSKMETMVSLFGDLYADEIIQVVNNLDKYRATIALVSKENQYAGSKEREFAERMHTTKAQLQLTINALSEAAINLGTAFLPAVVAAAKGVGVLAQFLADFTDQFPHLAAAAASALTVLAGFSALRLVWPLLRIGIVSLLGPLATLGRGLAFAGVAAAIHPIGAALTVAAGAAYVFHKATEASTASLQANADALGKEGQKMAEKIKSLKELHQVLVTTKVGTQEHIAAEEKLAAILPNANLSIDEQGRMMARASGETSVNTVKLREYIDLLDAGSKQTFIKQLEAQARAATAAKKELDDFSKLMKAWYGIGNGDRSAFQKLLDNLNSSEFVKDAARLKEFSRQTTESVEALKSMAVAAKQAGMSAEEFGATLDGFNMNATLRGEVEAYFRSIVSEAEAAAAKLPAVSDQMRQFSMAMALPLVTAKKSVVEAINVTTQQLSKYDETLAKHKTTLKQAVDEETKSWKTIADAAESAHKVIESKIEETYAARRRAVEDQALHARPLDSGHGQSDTRVLSEQAIVQQLTALAVQEANAKLAEARRYQIASLRMINEEYEKKKAANERLGIAAERTDEEMLQAKKRILGQMEASYHTSIDKLIAEEQRHLNAAKQAAQQLADFKLSVADRQARLSEKLMTPLQIDNSRQRRIAEEKAAGEKALQDGNYEAARRHADRMMDLAEQTSGEVRKGNRTVVSEQQAVARAAETIRQAAELAEKALMGMNKSHHGAAITIRNQLDAMAAGMAKARREMAELDKELAKNHKAILEIDSSKVKTASSEIDALRANIERLGKLKADLQVGAKALEKAPQQISNGDLDTAKAALLHVADLFKKFKEEFEGWDPEIKDKFNFESAASSIDGLVVKFDGLKATAKDPVAVTADTTTQAIPAIDDLTNRINALTAHPFTVIINEITRRFTEEAHAMGGPVGGSRRLALARGGSLPGYGGGDRISALLEAGEFVIRKEAVQRYGVGLLSAINNMRLDLPQNPLSANMSAFAKMWNIPRFASGDMSAFAKMWNIPRFAGGGLVGNLAIPSMPSFPQALPNGGIVRFEFAFPDATVGPVMAAPDVMGELQQAIHRQARGRR